MNVFFLAGSKGGLNRSNALKKSIKKLRIKIVIRWLAGFSGVAMQKKVEDKKKSFYCFTPGSHSSLTGDKVVAVLDLWLCSVCGCA